MIHHQSPFPFLGKTIMIFLPDTIHGEHSEHIETGRISNCGELLGKKGKTQNFDKFYTAALSGQSK